MTVTAPLVSIVIPCYLSTPKQAELLDETLRTVAAQPCRDFEIVIVDDGSPIDVRALAARHGVSAMRRELHGRPARAALAPRAACGDLAGAGAKRAGRGTVDRARQDDDGRGGGVR